MAILGGSTSEGSIVEDTPGGKVCCPVVSDRDRGINAGLRGPEGPAIGGEAVKCGSDGSDGGDGTSCLIGTEGDDGTEQSLGVSVQLRQCRRMLLLTLKVFLHLLQA